MPKNALEKLQSLKRFDREVLGLQDFNAADIAAIEKSEAPAEAKEFDSEMKLDFAKCAGDCLPPSLSPTPTAPTKSRSEGG